MVEQKRKQDTLRLVNGQEIKVNHLTKEDVTIGSSTNLDLEAKHGMTSQEFVAKWNRGELDCAEMDYFRWAGYCLFAYKQGRSELQLEG